MTRYAISFLALSTLVGCSGSTSLLSSDGKDDTQRAAWAATVKYPTDKKPSTDLKATLVVDGSDLKIYNATTQQLTDIKVWVNGTYVTRVDRISANGHLTLSRGEFFDSIGTKLSNRDVEIARIEIETLDGHLYTLQGPIRE